MEKPRIHPISEIYARLGLSQRQLAIHLGVSASYLSDVEAGLVARPSRLAKALDRIGEDGGDFLAANNAYREGRNE